MKNQGFVLLLALALCTTSCKNDIITEVQPKETISFHPLTSASSKVIATTESTLHSYNVMARAVNSAYSSFNFDETHTKLNGSWSSSATHYWPGDKSQEFRFTAISPAGFADSLSTRPTLQIESDKILGIRPKRQAFQQVDLMIARTRCSPSSTSYTSNGNKVPLQLKHALAQIIVQAQCDNPQISVEVVGVKLGNIVPRADFTIPNTESTGTMTGVWSNYVNEHTTYVSGGTDKSPRTLTASPQNIMMGDGSFMIIPQNPSASWNGTANDTIQPYIAVLCRIKQNNGNGNMALLYPTDANKFGYAAVGVNTQWTPGKTYTYTLKFFSGSGGAGKVPPETMDPSEPTDSKVDKTPTPGANVVGGALSFTVTTTDWNNNNNDLTPVQ